MLPLTQAQRIIIFDVNKTANGDVLACGTYLDFFDQPVLIGFAIRLDGEGNEIWRRTFTSLNEDGSYKTSDLFAIEELPDGNLLMTGGVRNPHEYNEDTIFYKDSWLIRTDEFGCLIGGCNDSIVSTVLMPINTTLTVYPNPSNGLIYVDFENLPVGDVSWSLIDNKGVIAKSGVEESLNKQFTIDGFDLSSGVYHLMLLSEGRRLIKKVVLLK